MSDNRGFNDDAPLMQEGVDDFSAVYDSRVLEFAAVGVEFCLRMEGVDSTTRSELLDSMCRLLPLLYLKGYCLPMYEWLGEEVAVDGVTEENYDIVRNNVALVMGEWDDYLDVFVEDMRYSDAPVLQTVSENLADLYQAVKNFALNYRSGYEPMMMAAIGECCRGFRNEWGQKLVNVLRAVHEVKLGMDDEEGK